MCVRGVGWGGVGGGLKREQRRFKSRARAFAKRRGCHTMRAFMRVRAIARGSATRGVATATASN